MDTDLPSLPNSLEARDRRSLVHGLTDLARHLEIGPKIIESGRGVWVSDGEGRTYLEGMSGLWCISLGYGQERLIAACEAQMRKLAYYHLTNHKGHPAPIELAEKLLEIAPVPMSHVWFANSGSESADCAARLCWYYWNAVGQPQKRKFLAHDRAYHGNTIAAASLTGTSYAHEGFNLPLDGFLHVATPHYLTGAQPDETEEQFVARLLAELEARILAEGPETIAAFFTEPVMAAGGVIVPPEGYFDGLQRLLNKHDILLVADEVVTAFGRTGEMFGTTRMGLEPDLIVLAKGLTSAYIPMSALMMNARIFDAISAYSGRLGIFGLTMTYSGHPVAAAVAREAIALYEELAIPERTKALEPVLLGGLRDRLGGHPNVGDIRGTGLLAGVQLVARRDPLTLFDASARFGPRVAALAEDNGLIVRAIGDTIAICPPLVIDEAEIAQLVDRLARAIEAAAAEPGA
ncbi:aminotransferase [Histidinibacterium lentulum]|uniref:Aminotransferase class III-fold pyridoxal phosphate-dependent enzyme n=1 Tax=Histidinibacterium lentulum TaxID=2480588 RepID=A0A3N2R5P5_9RHOB|nr:aminotransferase [Histidinibacterium lentulum]ROU02754.1 aminotransferase class III-fold pyridoxal phosphate-dependent enzyme [Histidinibacterium lentulum]